MTRVIRDQFTSLYKTERNTKFYGEITPAAPGTGADSQISYLPRRILTTKKNAQVVIGDVITGPSGKYLLLDHARNDITKQFKAIEITDTYRWQRRVLVTDFVTGLQTDSRLEVLSEQLPIIVEFASVISVKGIETVRFQVLTGADVRPGDLLNGYMVQTVKPSLGVKILEIT